MKKINYYLIALVAAIGCVFTSCSDEETNLSRAVLASVDILEYEALPEGPQIITVTSDADWVSEAPEWVTISPASGHAGQTEVEISVSENTRDAAVDNPRKTTIQFKGRNLWSIASVIVRQDGDKFRDPVDYTIEAMEAAEDETVVRLPNMIVTTVTGNGFIATDGTDYVYVKEPAIPVSVGKKVSIVGEKFTDEIKMAYVLGERMTDEGTAAVPEKTPIDITSTLDKTNGKKYQYVTLTGDFDGTAITVGEMTCKAYPVDAPQSLELGKLGGHKIKVTGYFAGMASPVVNIIPAEIEDLGVNEVIYFFDDFEWLAPWVAASGAGDQVGKFNSGDKCPQLQSCIYEDVSAFDAIEAKGYKFLFMGSDMKSSKDKTAKDCTYLQANYIKLGKTGYYAGITLPKLESVKAGDHVLLQFDWVPMCSGSQNFDDTLIVVIVENGNESTQFPVPEDTLTDKVAMEWQHVEIDLGSVNITPDTKISIRNIDDHWPLEGEYGKTGLVRYFLDNIKVKQAQ